MTLRHIRFLASLVLAANLGCHDAPTQPLTPISALNLDGKWTGRITYDASNNPGCPVSETFEATIAMSGSQFRFPVKTQCSNWIFDGRIVSDLSDANLVVQVEGPDEETVGRMGGAASDTRIDASALPPHHGGPISLQMTR